MNKQKPKDNYIYITTEKHFRTLLKKQANNFI